MVVTAGDLLRFIYVVGVCRFEISVGPSDSKGIFLRRGFLDKPEEFNVSIQPKFMTEKYYGKALLMDH